MCVYIFKIKQNLKKKYMYMHLGCGWHVGHPQSEGLWGIIPLIYSNENHLQRRRKQSEEEREKNVS